MLLFIGSLASKFSVCNGIGGRRQRGGAGDAFLRVFVREQPRAGLADDVRALLPSAVDVRIAPVKTIGFCNRCLLADRLARPSTLHLKTARFLKKSAASGCKGFSHPGLLSAGLRANRKASYFHEHFIYIYRCV